MTQAVSGITSERVDDLPVIVHWLQKMNLPALIDQQLPQPHGNRQGLSYGQLSVLLLAYILNQADHRLCAVEAWVRQHHKTLEWTTGWQIGLKDASDDRLADLVEVIGECGESREQIETSLGQQLIRAYELPTIVARCDTSSFSVYHHLEEQQQDSSLLRYGHSKDRRPDLRQYRQLLGTLDPAGIPLVEEPSIGVGFEMELGQLWQDPDTKQRYHWSERYLVVRSHALQQRQLQGLHQRLHRAEQALAKLAAHPHQDCCELLHQVQTILKRHQVSDFFAFEIQPQLITRYRGRGRPSAKDTTRQITEEQFTVQFQRQELAISEAEALAGWRIYVTNATVAQLTKVYRCCLLPRAMATRTWLPSLQARQPSGFTHLLTK